MRDPAAIATSIQSAEPPVTQYFLGRQPILDRKQNLHGFELLFRSGQTNSAQGADAVLATANVMNIILHNPHMLDTYKGYINVDQTFLASDMLEMLAPSKIGFEIMKSVEINDITIIRCRQLKSLGFELVLDDYSAAGTSRDALLDIVDMVKVDIRDAGLEALPAMVKHLRRWSLKIVAQKVESPDEFARCRELGVDFYQGYFFARPKVASGRRLAHSELALLKLIRLVESDATIAAIESVLRTEASLTIDLLRLTNSAASPVRHHIKSITHALMVLGQQQLRCWLQLLLFSRLAPGATFPSPLLHLVATRARFMEISIEKLAKDDAELAGRAFLAGVISLMSSVLDQPLHVVLEHLDLAPDIWDAVLERKGLLGGLIEIAEFWEQGDFQQCLKACAKVPGMDLPMVNSAQLTSLTWANSLGSAGAADG
jgi:EAL and modified HD-GYP domain-containing signal transduction protein